MMKRKRQRQVPVQALVLAGLNLVRETSTFHSNPVYFTASCLSCKRKVGFLGPEVVRDSDLSRSSMHSVSRQQSYHQHHSFPGGLHEPGRVGSLSWSARATANATASAHGTRRRRSSRSSSSSSSSNSRKDTFVQAGFVGSEAVAFALCLVKAMVEVIQGLFNRYDFLLTTSPLYTKSISAGLISCLGDFITQRLERRGFGSTKNHSKEGTKGVATKWRLWGSDSTDVRRSFAVMCEGVFLTGPLLHVLYSRLEHYLPSVGAEGWLPAAGHVLADTLLFDPLFVVAFFCFTGLLEGKPLLRDVLPRLRDNFFSAVRASWLVSVCFWPVQYLGFRYLPLHYRVMLVNVCDCVWTAVLSFYSHKKGEGERESDGSSSNSSSSSSSSEQAAA